MTIEKTADLKAGTVTWNFGDGSAPLTLEVSKLSPEVQLWLAVHGAAQKGGDSYAGAAKAIAKPEAEFRTVEAYARDQVEGIIDMLQAGKWSERATSTGPRATILAEAYSRVKGIDIPTAKARIAQLDDEKTDMLARALSKVVDQIKLERLQARIKAAEEKPVEMPEGL